MAIESAFSLVLGGGAARGLTHIGVIQYFEESNQRPSEIIGTSIGALIGALYAFGYTSHQMQRIAHEIKIISLIDISLTTGSIKGKKIITLLKKYLQDRRIEDSPIPLCIVATNIETGEKVVFRKGSVVEAIRASISIPGVFDPYKIGGKLLVDGGLVSNLPAEESDSLFRVVAVSAQISLKSVPHAPSKGHIFTRGTPFTHKYALIRKTMAIMMASNEDRSIATRKDIITLRPDSTVDYYEFDRVDELIESGYREAKVKLLL